MTNGKIRIQDDRITTDPSLEDAMKMMLVAPESSPLRSLRTLLSAFGNVDLVSNERSALIRYLSALDASEPYHFIFIEHRHVDVNAKNLIKNIRTHEKHQQQPSPSVTLCCLVDDCRLPGNCGRWYCSGDRTFFMLGPLSEQELVTLARATAHAAGEYYPLPHIFHSASDEVGTALSR